MRKRLQSQKLSGVFAGALLLVAVIFLLVLQLTHVHRPAPGDCHQQSHKAVCCQQQDQVLLAPTLAVAQDCGLVAQVDTAGAKAPGIQPHWWLLVLAAVACSSWPKVKTVTSASTRKLPRPPNKAPGKTAVTQLICVMRI